MPHRRTAAAPPLLRTAVLAALIVPALLLGSHRLAVGSWWSASRGEVRGSAGEAIDSYLRRVEAFGFAGSVLVARRGEVLLDRGYGLADVERGEPYAADTLFDVASVSKQFTAAAIVELEMQGRLRVEDPLSKFFPGAPADKARITLHQLLTHTAGLPDVLGAEYERVSRDEMLRRIMAAPLVAPPGRHFRYSNAGYSLLAAVAEITSGRPLGELMRQQLFLPAGMRHTGFRLPAWDRRRVAHGYSLDGPWGTPLDRAWAPDGPFWNLRGNGGVLSTTGDLYRWDQALAGDRVLSRAEREKLITPYVREGPNTPSRYAYGWSITQAPDGSKLASHTGGNGVFETDFRRYLDDQMVVVTSSNRADYSGISVAEHLERRLFKEPDPEPPAPVRLEAAELRRCAGLYALPGGERLQVAAGGGGLLITAAGPAGLALLLGGQDTDERGLMKMREEKVAAALDGARRGDFEPLADLFGLPAARVQRPFLATLHLFEHQLGAWTGAAVLGSESVGGYPYTYARLSFAHGTRLAQYRWQGPTAEVVRYPPHPIPYFYLPEHPPASPGAVTAAGAAKSGGAADRAQHFGAYDVRTGAVQRLRVELPPHGPPLALAVEAAGGEVTALWSGTGAALQ
jgi:CubicO group peptidase (beta-lactamase class C family)